MLRRWSALCTVALLVSLPVSPAAADPPSPRLRPQSPRAERWLADGIARSKTFRALVARIERGDVIVYLESQPALGPGLSACVTWMATTPQVRFVRASIRPDLRARDTLAMVAHELHHVVELLDHPEVQSARGLADLYQRIGHSIGATGDRWDTTAALETGDQVRLELLG
jgi:hypothetical protein